MPTSVLHRARAFVQAHPEPEPAPEVGDERNESNELIPNPADEGGVAGAFDETHQSREPVSYRETGLIPLDAEIARSEARKHDRAGIVARLARLEARAAAPGASPLDRQLVADWRAILAARI